MIKSGTLANTKKKKKKLESGVKPKTICMVTTDDAVQFTMYT